ncbi:hypothetical protein [Ruegeria atlantica]|uniref:hypothetical protein n=1 Tax=Ruegeria atlantica TaxID=81569 RepID=UPI00147F965C|nr:hypothetical protein [Ruegeria atlantica]
MRADPAPVVKGHPETDAPAYGWVEALRVAGDRLQAKLARLDPAFRSEVEAGSFGPRSVALQPLPGAGWRLRHLGFLGGARAAVDGLSPSQFACGAADIFCFSSEDEMNTPVFTSVRTQPAAHVVQNPGPQPASAYAAAVQPAAQRAQPNAQPAQQVVALVPNAAPAADPAAQTPQQFATQDPCVTAAQPMAMVGVQWPTPAQPGAQPAPQPVQAFAADPGPALPPNAAQVDQAAAQQTLQPGTANASEAVQLAAERQALFSERQAIAAERVAHQQIDRERSAQARVQAHVTAGRVTPGEAPAYAALFCALDTAGGQMPMAGADGRTVLQTPSTVLDALLAQLPQRVPLGAPQHTAQAFSAPVPVPPAQPGAPAGDPQVAMQTAAEQLARDARALMAADKSGTLDLPSAIQRARAGEKAQ